MKEVRQKVKPKRYKVFCKSINRGVRMIKTGKKSKGSKSLKEKAKEFNREEKVKHIIKESDNVL